jgi:hypothetical protein
MSLTSLGTDCLVLIMARLDLASASALALSCRLLLRTFRSLGHARLRLLEFGVRLDTSRKQQGKARGKGAKKKAAQKLATGNVAVAPATDPLETLKDFVMQRTATTLNMLQLFNSCKHKEGRLLQFLEYVAKADPRNLPAAGTVSANVPYTTIRYAFRWNKRGPRRDSHILPALFLHPPNLVACVLRQPHPEEVHVLPSDILKHWFFADVGPIPLRGPSGVGYNLTLTQWSRVGEGVCPSCRLVMWSREIVSRCLCTPSSDE